MLRESYHWIAGPASRQLPVLGSLLFAAVLLRPVLQLSRRDLRVVGHGLRAEFDHRYGHLVLPNRGEVLLDSPTPARQKRREDDIAVVAAT